MSDHSSSRPDVTEMKAVHRVFRDTLGAVPDLVGGVGSGDVERLGLISNFYENVLSFLHAHHQTEEELVFPLLRDRCPDDLALVERAAEQHEAVLASAAEAERAVAAWAKEGPSSQAAASGRLSTLGDLLGEHLDEEEQNLLPLCAANLTAEEWGAQPPRGISLFAGDKIWLILGLIRQRMTDTQRQDMLTHMPPPAVEMWTGFGEQAFNELMADVGAPLA
jgi:hemerythrin-like domain-containing protein